MGGAFGEVDLSDDEEQVANFGHPDFTIYFPSIKNDQSSTDHLSEIEEDCNDGSNNSKSINIYLSSYIQNINDATLMDIEKALMSTNGEAVTGRALGD